MKTAKVFQHGNSQAVRLPKEFRFADDEVIVKRHAGGVLLLPRQYDPKDLLAIVERFEGPIETGDDPVPQTRDF
jgi:antitoxin VapB